MSVIPRDALYRTAISTVLKSVGIVARILDIPTSQGDLRQRVAQRELVDLGVIVAASLAIEGVSHALGPKRKLTGMFQFLPQLTAYIFAEWFSRKATNFNQHLNEHLTSTAPTPAVQPLPSTTPARLTLAPTVKTEKQAVFDGYQRYYGAHPNKISPSSVPAYPYYGMYQTPYSQTMYTYY